MDFFRIIMAPKEHQIHLCPDRTRQDLKHGWLSANHRQDLFSHQLIFHFYISIRFCIDVLPALGLPGFYHDYIRQIIHEAFFDGF